MNSKILRLAFDMGLSIAELVMDAFQENDPAKLQKVTDILPEGHELRSRAAFAMAQQKAVNELGKP